MDTLLAAYIPKDIQQGQQGKLVNHKLQATYQLIHANYRVNYQIKL